jgi:hypothetical protein
MCNCTSEVWSFGPSRNDRAKRVRDTMTPTYRARAFCTSAGVTKGAALPQEFLM